MINFEFVYFTHILSQHVKGWVSLQHFGMTYNDALL